jgi:DnaJ-class molecular chaperone
VVYEQPVHRGGDNSTTEDGFPGVGFPGPIRSTYKEVLTHKDSDMIQETAPNLCTRCRGEGRVLGPTKPHHPMHCPECGGDGIGNQTR